MTRRLTGSSRQCLPQNFDLAESVARVEQARTRARIANAVRYPMLQPSAGAEDTDTPTNAGVAEQIDEIGLSPELKREFDISVPDRLAVTTYSLSANFSYEADFWDRNRNDTRVSSPLSMYQGLREILNFWSSPQNWARVYAISNGCPSGATIPQ